MAYPLKTLVISILLVAYFIYIYSEIQSYQAYLRVYGLLIEFNSIKVNLQILNWRFIIIYLGFYELCTAVNDCIALLTYLQNVIII